MVNKKIKSMEDDNTEENDARELKLMAEIFGLSLKNLITKIDVYSQDSQGRKLVIGKRFYSAEDLILGKANDIFHTTLISAIEHEFKISPNDIMNFGYPDQNMNPKTIIISITHYIEKEKRGEKTR